MKVTKLLLASTVAAGALILNGCTEGDQTSLVVEGSTTNNGGTGGTGGGGGTGTISACPDFASPRPRQNGTNVCQLPNSILDNITLTADTIWRIQDRVTVGNGNLEMSATEGQLANGNPVDSAVLTIEAGTSIVAAPGFSNIVITRGSQIQAFGTAAEPIIMSSEDAGFDGNGEWGGLVLHGYARHNTCTGQATCNVAAEGESGLAGGFNDTDSSGTLNYVIVAEGGFEFSTGNEINGISFVSVGSGTNVDYIQVHNNSDDGVEFYGGTVNAKHVVLTSNDDDSLDWDEGWIGNMQYVLVVQDTDAGDHCIEADTTGGPDPLSIPSIVNGTFVCVGDPEDEGFNLKASTGGFFHHVIIDVDGTATTPDACVSVEGTGAQNNATGNGQPGGQPTLDTNQFICDAGTFEIDASGATTTNIQTTPVSTDDPQLNATYQAQSPAASGITPTDFADYNANVNANSTALPGFLDETDYIGAVDPGATGTLWFQGWTLDGTL